MEIKCLSSTIKFKNSTIFISPCNYEIPLYQIKEFIVLKPCKDANGVIQISLYDFINREKEYFLYIYKDDVNFQAALNIAQVVHDYEADIDSDESLDFIDVHDFYNIKEKKAYIKHLSLLNSNEISSQIKNCYV